MFCNTQFLFVFLFFTVSLIVRKVKHCRSALTKYVPLSFPQLFVLNVSISIHSNGEETALLHSSFPSDFLLETLRNKT